TILREGAGFVPADGLRLSRIVVSPLSRQLREGFQVSARRQGAVLEVPAETFSRQQMNSSSRQRKPRQGAKRCQRHQAFPRLTSSCSYRAFSVASCATGGPASWSGWTSPRFLSTP